MANRSYTEHAQRKVAKAKPSRSPAGVTGSTAMPMKSSGYPGAPGKVWKTSFNRSAKFPVGKEKPAKAGVD